MLALLLFIAITVIFAVAAKVLDDWYLDGLCLICIVVSVLAGFVALIMIIFAVDVNLCAAGEKAEKQQVYSSLLYQLENQLYENDNDIGKKELYSEITDWNAEVAKGKEMQHSLWVGILYPDIYDDLNLIPLDETWVEQETVP